MLLFHLVLITLLALNVKVLFGMTGIMTPSTAQLATQPTEEGTMVHVSSAQPPKDPEGNTVKCLYFYY